MEKIFDLVELSGYLRKAASTIKNDLRRAPHRVPRPWNHGGRRLLWRQRDVQAFLDRGGKK